MSENNNVSMRTITCPACGGKLDLPVGRNKSMCTFCGNEVVVDEPGWLGELDKFDLKVRDAQTALDNKEWTRALMLFEECSMINESDPRPWKGIVETKTKRFTTGFSENTESAFNCYMHRSGLGMNDPFIDEYKAFIERVSDNDAGNAAGYAKENIEYFKRMIDGYTDSIGDLKGKIQDIKNAPTAETAEKRYGGAKASLAINTVLLVVAPLAVVGFIILAVVLLVGTIQGDPHIIGIIASIVAALVFAGITKYVYKHQRQSIQTFKKRRVSKLQEDHINDERAKNNERNIDSKNSTITEYEGNIEFLKKGIEEINGYLAIDRDKRISFFTKKHLDTAGIDNSIVIDEAITRFGEIEKDYKRMYLGYKSLAN